MAIHSYNQSTLKRPSPQVSQSNKIIAPILGINSRTSLSKSNPDYALYAYNLIPAEYGSRVRNGYREHAIGFQTVNGLGIRTVIPFGGTDSNSDDDRLFAVTNEGIWSATTEAAVPALLIDFSLAGNGANTTDEAGFGVFTAFTTDANEKILWYADSINGLFIYTASTDLWTRAVGITGLDITKINFVTQHDRRLWFIEQNESKASYLDPAVIAGAVKDFFFGSKFKNGGDLAGLFSWTIDGGEGMDDHLVAVSRAGDVIPYKGFDPNSADSWVSVGHYFIGGVPKGGRFADGSEGNLRILSAFGVISMDEVVAGVDGKNINALNDTGQVAAYIRNDMRKSRLDNFWEMSMIPSSGALLINTPQHPDGNYIQYIMDTTTRGWGILRSLPALSFTEWAGNVYIGTKDNRLMIMDVFLDDVKITPPASGSNGEPIDFSILTTYSDFGQPAQFKRGKYIRVDFVSETLPQSTSRFLYDYDLAEITDTSKAEPTTGGDWDQGSWDQSVWGATIANPRNFLSGGWGIGRTIAVATRGKTSSDTTLVGWDVVWDAGNPI